MGAVDIASRAYLAQPERFADVCNYLIYDGQQVVCPEELRHLDSAGVVPPHGKGRQGVREGRRDLLRLWEAKCDDHAVYAILGVESQLKVHRAMPVRCMLYDAMAYADQVARIARENRTAGKVRGNDYLSGIGPDDRLLPVVTLVVYFGPDKWDAPLSLGELLAEHDGRLLQYAQDYRMGLIAPAQLKEDDFDKFVTDLGMVLEYVKYSRDRQALDKLVHEDGRFRNMSVDGAELLNLVTGSNLRLTEEEGRVDMCKAIDDMRRESIEQGIEQGAERNLLENIRTLTETLGLTALQVMDKLRVPEEDRPRYLAML